MPSDFFAGTWPVSKKAYRCEWCGEEIKRGERHYKMAGMWEGDFQKYRMHAECAEAMFCETYYGGGFSPFENDRPEIVVEIGSPS